MRIGIQETSYSMISRLVNKWEINGKINDIDFLCSLIEKDRIYTKSEDEEGILAGNLLRNLKKNVSNYKIETIRENLIMMKKVLDDFFKDLWSFSLIVTDYPKENSPRQRISFNLCIKILFPSIEIKNRLESKHLIRDLVVFLPLKNSRNFLPFLVLGTRLTMDEIEKYYGYHHSHLPSSTFSDSREIYLDRFCLGSEGINYSLSDFSKGNTTEKQFLLFLLELESLVSYESLEGGPHIRISGLVQKSPLERSSSFPAVVGVTFELCLEILKIYIKKGYNILTFTSREFLPSISNEHNLMLDSIIEECPSLKKVIELNTYYQINDQFILLSKVENYIKENFSKKDKVKESVIVEEDKYFFIRNRNFKRKVIYLPPQEIIIEEKNKKINTYLYEQIAREIRRIIFYKVIRDYSPTTEVIS